jgi:tetratricopeptide (TPR) repeat protein
MTEQQKEQETPKEEKSQAQLDYEAGQEFLKNLETAQAANAFHNALIAFEIEGNDSGVANAADKLGDICAARGDVATALSHYDRAYAICQKHTDRFSLFSIEKKKAKLMYDAKEYDQAVHLYGEVLNEYSALRNPQGSVDTLETLAEIYLAMGEKSKAADSYRTAASIHKNFRHSHHAEKLLQKAAAIEQG